MKVKLDAGAYMPTRAHDDDAGLDLYARDTQVVPAKESATFDTGVHVELPYWYYHNGFYLDKHPTVGLVKSKSGLYMNHDITTTGVVDVGYTGSIRVKLQNNSGYDYKVNAGDKIGQLVIVPCFALDVEQCEELKETERGNNGFGSTGK